MKKSTPAQATYDVEVFWPVPAELNELEMAVVEQIDWANTEAVVRFAEVTPKDLDEIVRVLDETITCNYIHLKVRRPRAFSITA